MNPLVKPFDYYKQREEVWTKKRKRYISFVDKRPVRDYNPNEVLIIDGTSNEPPLDQVKRQIIQFTKNQNLKRLDLASMDQLTDLIEIEKEFGAIQLGANENRIEIDPEDSQFLLKPINK